MRFASQTLGFPWKEKRVVLLGARTRQKQASR